MTHDRPAVTVGAVTGGFAVPDPHDPDTMTYWWCDVGVMTPYPFGTRWAPLPPRFGAASRDERRELRNDWYSEVYWPWKVQVADTILADLASARARFAAAYPTVTLVKPPTVARRSAAERAAADRRAEALWAAVHAGSGQSVRAVARELDCSWATARSRVTAGSVAWAADPAAARQLLIDRYTPVAGRVDVPQLIDRLLAGAGLMPVGGDMA
ncbi:hypothetical protein AB0K00_20705 [Dactylosporangium sp. NPDC049525]|uniref:hypothetical protein n=1 Tax=Dactylosporangium sp. NPDC049525 TaxID=3154730 RepID=UPI003430D26E